MPDSLVKIVIYTPVSHAAKIRVALSEGGAGNIGKYDTCSYSVIGTGKFRPQPGSNPTIGHIGNIVSVEEERIETICPERIVRDVIRRIRDVHPYEEPAIDVYPLLNDRYQ